MSTAGYSGTPLPRKLGIREDGRVLLVGAPDGFADVLGELPPGVEFVAERKEVDVAVLFAPTPGSLRRASGSWPTSFGRPAASGSPGRSAARASTTDLHENLVREHGLDKGLVDNKVCAIDGTWSGLRFVRRLRDRPGRT